MPSNPIALVTLAAAMVAAIAVDLRCRRVPNGLTASLALAGLAGAASGLSGVSMGAALAGGALGLALMLPGHLFGATGAGDVKLFAAAGALLGPGPVVLAFLYTALAGGVCALVVAARRRRLALTVRAASRLVTCAGGRGDIHDPARDNRFAYAPAIAAGTLLAALGV